MRKGLLVLLSISTLWIATPLTATASTASRRTNCGKFSGTVVLTYSNPDTIVLHIIRGKVNAATVFTMTPTTSYTRNGQPASFADIMIGDTGMITAYEILPSGTLLACTVTVNGP